MRYRDKKIGCSIITQFVDCCPHCKIHFRSRRVKVLWHDVVECQKCGYTWILANEKVYLSWMMKRKSSGKMA